MLFGGGTGFYFYELHEEYRTNSSLTLLDLFNDEFSARLNLEVPAEDGLLSNDEYPDGQGRTIELYDYTQTQRGSLAVSKDGAFTYARPDDFCGWERFRYRHRWFDDGNEEDTGVVSDWIQVLIESPRWEETLQPSVECSDAVTVVGERTVSHV